MISLLTIEAAATVGVVVIALAAPLEARVSYLSPVPEREIAVRLVVNSDGSGQIERGKDTDPGEMDRYSTVGGDLSKMQ